MARSTRLLILIKNIYTLWGRERFLLPVTYFPTSLVYPLTLRVTGIKMYPQCATGKYRKLKLRESALAGHALGSGTSSSSFGGGGLARTDSH